MVDYSKWDNLELSDSDDAEEVHPNIDRKAWFRLKREINERDKAERQQRITDIQSSFQNSASATNPMSIEQRESLEEELQALLHKETSSKKWRPSDTHETFSRSVINKKDDQELKTVDSNSHHTAANDKPDDAIHVSPGEPNHKDSLNEITDDARDEDNFVRDMERKAWEYVQLDDFSDIEAFLRLHPEVVCAETDTYLLLHARDKYRIGQRNLSRRLIHHSLLVRYIIDVHETLHVPLLRAIHTFLQSLHGKSRSKRVFYDDLEQFWEKFAAIQDEKKEPSSP